MPTTKATIFKLVFGKGELVLPTLNDIKAVIMDNEELLDMLLLKQLDIQTEQVDKHSKKYQTAVTNALVQVKG